MMRNTLLGIACLGWLAVNGCTVPGDTTKLGAATGGIIGAGVGALVGSQTATPAGGLIVGGLAGSAAGAAVGNALEAHEEQLRRQDEALEKQQRIILSQQAEIEELRRLGQDNVAFESRSRLSPNISSNAKAPYHKKGRQRSALIERKIQIRDNSRASTIATVGDSVGAISPPRVPSNRKSLSLNSEQCKKAEKTALKARESQDDSDKLFYYKTAARLCPDNPAFHINIARHYIKQGREEDAKFEFETALSLDPDNEEALAGLSDISQGIGE